MRVLLVSLLFISAVSAYKYLVYNPLFGHSHCNFLGKIADTLAEAGHDVTVLAPVLEPLLADKKYGKKANKVIKVEADPRVLKMMEDNRNGMFRDLWTISPTPIALMSMARNMSLMFSYSCDKMINEDNIISQLRNENFDVVIAEPFQICGFGIAEAIGVKTVISAFSGVNLDIISWYIGEPSAPSYVPSLSAVTEKMSFFQRLGNAVGAIVSMHTFNAVYEEEGVYLRKKFGSNYSGHAEAIGRSTYSFVNGNPYLDFPRPLIHKTVQIGGITVDTSKPEKLDEKWDKILSERKKNVFISFGSVAKSKDMPQNFKNQLLDVFASMPEVTFIWKYEEETKMADHLPNVHLSPWLPQKSLLADPRLSAFVTHGGLGSTTEVAYLGKPAIMIPLFAEQPRNAAMLSRHGCALVLHKDDLADANIIRNTIKTMLDNEQYAASATRLSQMLKEQPTTARDLVVKHAEFAAKFGPLPHIDPYGRQLSIVQYYLLDVLAFVLLVLVILISLPIYVIRRFCCAKKQKQE